MHLLACSSRTISVCLIYQMSRTLIHRAIRQRSLDTRANLLACASSLSSRPRNTLLFRSSRAFKPTRKVSIFTTLRPCCQLPSLTRNAERASGGRGWWCMRRYPRMLYREAYLRIDATRRPSTRVAIDSLTYSARDIFFFFIARGLSIDDITSGGIQVALLMDEHVSLTVRVVGRSPLNVKVSQWDDFCAFFETTLRQSKGRWLLLSLITHVGVYPRFTTYVGDILMSHVEHIIESIL